MPKVLLPISHLKQTGEGDCLVACAGMILDHLGLTVRYADLLRLLQVRSFGAPAGNIRLLAQLGLTVTYSVTDLNGIVQLLDVGVPVIAFLRTGDLPYWQYSTDHAVVVVGYNDDTQQVYLNDPYARDACIAVSRGDFELAWSERDYHYATLSR